MSASNDNREWWKVHIPGQVVQYGDWEISYNPPPIPSRNCDWQYCHKDFDGADDACDARYGSAGSLIEAMDEIDDRISDEWEEKGCSSCGLISGPEWCIASTCKHREDQRLRTQIRAIVEESDS